MNELSAIRFFGKKDIASFSPANSFDKYSVENPYDLAGVDRVLWASITKELHKKPDGQPLVILMGESHAHPTTILPQIGVISHLAKWRDSAPDNAKRTFVTTVESPNNLHQILFSALRQVHGEDINSRAKYLNGYYALLGSLNYSYIDTAPHSHLAVESRCLDKAVPFRYVDATPETGEDYAILSPEDEVAAHLAEKLFGRDLSEASVSVISSEGLTIRNEVMVQRSLNFAKEMDSELIIHSCGFSHLYGRNSLTEIFEREGARVLSFLPIPENFLEEHEKTALMQSNAIQIDGLSLKESFYSPGTNLAEIGFLKKLFTESSDKSSPSCQAQGYISEDMFMRVFKHNLYQIPA